MKHILKHMIRLLKWALYLILLLLLSYLFVLGFESLIALLVRIPPLWFTALILIGGAALAGILYKLFSVILLMIIQLTSNHRLAGIIAAVGFIVILISSLIGYWGEELRIGYKLLISYLLLMVYGAIIYVGFAIKHIEET